MTQKRNHLPNASPTPPPRWDVLGLGVVAVDDTLYIAHFDGPDTKMPILEMRRGNGGLVATALVAAARMGACTAFFAQLGSDELSLYSRQSLVEQGVDCSFLIQSQPARPIYAVVVVERSSGRRIIFYSNRDYQVPDAALVNEALIQDTRVLLVDHTAGQTGIAAARLARQRGIAVVADFEEVDTPVQQELLSVVDHLIIHRRLGELLTGEQHPEAILLKLGQTQRSCTVITDGDSGCWYLEAGQPISHQPALRVEIVNTTGCGDVFHGVYAAMIARGEPVVRAVRIATIYAGMKASRPAGWEHFPTQVDVHRFEQSIHPGSWSVSQEVNH